MQTNTDIRQRRTTQLLRTYISAARPLLLIGIMFLGLLPLTARATSDHLTAGAASNDALTLLVRFAPDTSQAIREQVVAELGGEWVDWLPQISVAEIRIASPRSLDGVTGWGDDIIAAGRVAHELSYVYSIEADFESLAPFESAIEPPLAPDSAITAHSTSVTEPTTAATAPTIYALHNIDAWRAWEITTGSPSITIAILDSGINMQHPEFQGRLVAGYDFVNDDNDPADDTGHGTHVAGIAGATMDNQSNVTGVCPNCTIMPVKVLNESNSGNRAALAKGILFAVDHGARIINMSLGAFSLSPTVEAALEYAHAHDVLLIASAGNSNNDQPFYPAAYPWVIAVSATDANDARWYNSSYGSFVEVAAPGRLIYSTYYRFDEGYGGYTYMSGTSMAAPFVAGLAGLLFSQNPGYTSGEVRSLIATYADDLGEPGVDPYFGYGRINAGRTLTRHSVAQPLLPLQDQNSVQTGDGGILGTPPEIAFPPAVSSPSLSTQVYLPAVMQH